MPAPARQNGLRTDGRLPLLETEVGRVLAIPAHPDDLEYGASAAVASWTWAGHDVVYLLVTRGEAGIDGLDPAEAGPLREREQRASARVVGVRQVEFLGYAEGVVESGPRLRRDLAAAIRRHRPDTLLLVNHRDVWGPGMPNTADHRAVGVAALDAMADAGNRWLFRDLVDDLRLDPHSPRRAVVASSPQSSHLIPGRCRCRRCRGRFARRAPRVPRSSRGPSMANPEILRMWLHKAVVSAPVFRRG